MLIGQPRQSLGDLVRKVNSQLLVVGARGQEQGSGAGSTALACVRNASADVLVVGNSEADGYRTVLAATGLGRESGEVVMRAAEMVRPGGRLVVLHALAPPWQRLLPGARDRFEQWAREGLDRRAAQATDYCDAHQVQVQVVLAMGRDIPDTVVNVAREHHCDLIVVGKRSRSAMANTLLGSIAMTVITSAPCSVLAVHTLVAEGDGSSFEDCSI